MALTKKQKLFIGNSLIDDIEANCSLDNKNNVVKFKVVSSSTPKKQEITDFKERHAILTKRKVLWEIVQKGTELRRLESGQEVMVDGRAAIQAIIELNKLDGHRAPKKYEHTYIVKFVDGGKKE